MNAKKILILVFAMVMCITSMVVPVAAAEERVVDVRVNGYLVDFPDQRPIVNEDNRTLIPVRFVAEELGAEVTWDGKQQAAVIKKDGQTITIPIGEKELKVTDANGKSSTVAMDTEAVVKNGRTLVPIRFVAEAMGCYVSFSSSFQTVEIYKDVLTPDEIEEIRDLSFSGDFCNENLKYKKSSTTFEDMNELAFQQTVFARHAIKKSRNSNMTWDSQKNTTEHLANLFVDNAKKHISDSFTDKSYGVKATFRTDASAIVNAPGEPTATPYIIYGYLTLEIGSDANVAAYKNFYSNCNFGNMQTGNTYTFLIETLWHSGAASEYPMHYGTWNRTNGATTAWN